MSYIINTASTISHQDLFGKSKFFDELNAITNTSELISPNYKEYIPSALLRRLSKILKTSIVASIECNKQVTDEFDSVIVGTGLGCLTDTEKFLNISDDLFLRDYSLNLGHKCYLCKSKFHSELYCPLVHFSPNKTMTIAKSNYSNP